MPHPFPRLTADEAAALIRPGDLVGFSGFSAAGTPKAVPAALARRAAAAQADGAAFRIRVLTGANGGPTLDEVLAEGDAVAWRSPYQSAKLTRRRINAEAVDYVDLPLSQVAPAVEGGALGPVDCAVVEATALSADGRLHLTTSIGVVPTLLHRARRVIVELNRRQHPRLHELADVYRVAAPPLAEPLAIRAPLDRIGTTHALVDPAKVAGVVETDDDDHTTPFTPPDEDSRRIAGHVTAFLLDEVRRGRLPAESLVLQAGVGNMGNAVLAGMGADPAFPPFAMYTEVLQDSLVDLLLAGRVTAVSAASLATGAAQRRVLLDHFDRLARQVVLRPSEISNSPEVIRRLGVVAINTAIDFDIYGNVNSTHFAGTEVMNGIGGSGDFAANSRLAIFTAPSIRKHGRVSSVVPMCAHVDHNEHAVDVLVTEQGVADLRGLDPKRRAARVIEACAHPLYRDYLRDYVKRARPGHIRHDLRRCFELYANFDEQGAMLPSGRPDPE